MGKKGKGRSREGSLSLFTLATGWLEVLEMCLLLVKQRPQGSALASVAYSLLFFTGLCTWHGSEGGVLRLRGGLGGYL